MCDDDDEWWLVDKGAFLGLLKLFPHTLSPTTTKINNKTNQKKVECSSLTGESELVTIGVDAKSDIAAEARNLVFMSCLVMNGEGRGVVVRTGVCCCLCVCACVCDARTAVVFFPQRGGGSSGRRRRAPSHLYSHTNTHPLHTHTQTKQKTQTTKTKKRRPHDDRAHRVARQRHRRAPQQPAGRGAPPGVVCRRRVVQRRDRAVRDRPGAPHGPLERLCQRLHPRRRRQRARGVFCVVCVRLWSVRLGVFSCS